MPYPIEASTVILFGSWFDEQSRAGMNATITATPLPPTGATTPGGAYTPNLTDAASYAWLKTRTWTTTPLASGLYALPLTANDDPDLTAFGGWQITAQGESPFIVNVSVTANTITVTNDLAAAISACAAASGSSFSVPVGATVQAVHMTEAAVLTNPAPQPPAAYLTSAQTSSLIASSLASYQGGGGSSLVPTTIFTSNSHTPVNGEYARYNPSSNLTISLPSASAGQRFGVANVSTGTSTLTFNRQGSDSFSDGSTSISLAAGERAVLIGASGGFTIESRTVLSSGAALTQRGTAATANTTAIDNEIVPVDTSNGAFTITGPSSGKPFGVRWRAGTAAPTVAAPSGYTINGTGSITLGLAPSSSQGELVTYQAVGTDYQPFGGFKPQTALDIRYPINASTTTLSGASVGQLLSVARVTGGTADRFGLVSTNAITAASIGADPALVATSPKSSTYSAAAGDLVPVDTSTGNVTVNLPASPADGSVVAVKHVIRGGANTVTVAASGGAVFDVASGPTTYPVTLLGQGAVFEYQATTSIWFARESHHSLGQLDTRYKAPTPSALSQVTIDSTGNLSTRALPDVQAFTTPGTFTWTKPTGATKVTVALIAGGAGGGSGARLASGTASSGGGGGGAGSYSFNVFRASDLATSETVIVGGGGNGGAAVTADSTNGNAGATGGASAFGTSIKVRNGGSNAGAGGSASAASGGSGSSGFSNGSPGGNGSVGVAGLSGTGAAGPAGSGGGGGGGVSTTPAAFAGGAGGGSTQLGGGATAGSAGTASGGAGGAGVSAGGAQPVGGGGGGGGGSSITGAGGNGGSGGAFGSGGGGGGSSLNGSNSGAGGAGSGGIVLVISE